MGKKERGIQGLHDNRTPFGTKKNKKKILVREENEFSGLLMAFESYATDNYSDNDIGMLLNKHGYKTKAGRPFSKDTVRDMLQNQTYLGKVKYQRRSNGSRSYEAPVKWYDGQHEAFIDEALFNRCMAVRTKRRSHCKATSKYNPYLLRNLIFCHRCLSNPPEGKLFPQYGKMRPQARKNNIRSSEQEYMKLRIELQHELEQLTPVADDELEQTANILENFAEHWQRLEGDEDGRHELVKLIVDRVHVEDETVVAMTLKSNYHLVLGHNAKEPTEQSVDPYVVPGRARRDSLTPVCDFSILAKTYCSKALI
ncbi:MAG: hypothetical protein GY943_28485 [Chloroflexi bacterium]|nr:hypothetical protein [Chloroflexota bacterium]